MNTQEQTQQFETGETVLLLKYHNTYGRNTVKAIVVKRQTKTLIIVEERGRECKFSQHDGPEKHDTWDTNIRRLVKFDQALLDDFHTFMKREAAINRLTSTDWRQLTDEQIVKMVEILL